METVPWMTILAYTPFSSSPKTGPRKHWVKGLGYCKVYEWEENLNPKITIFRYEEGKRLKNREDDRPDGQKSKKTKAPSSKQSFDPRSAAGAVAVKASLVRTQLGRQISNLRSGADIRMRAERPSSPPLQPRNLLQVFNA